MERTPQRSKDSITILINTHNEESQIEDCINSAFLLSSKVVVIDSESNDSTGVLAVRKGVEVMSFKNESGIVEPSRSYGIGKIETTWVFVMDADERMTSDLAGEIKVLINSTPPHSYYFVPRKNIFAGKKWLKHGGWYPDNVIRLIKKSSFVNWPGRIHATPVIKGSVGFLKNPLSHYFHPGLENMVNKTIVYENREADLLFSAGRQVSVVIFFRKFLGELYRRLIKNKGFLDGMFGIIESFYQAFSKTITYIYLYEKNQKNSTL